MKTVGGKEGRSDGGRRMNERRKNDRMTAADEKFQLKQTNMTNRGLALTDTDVLDILHTVSTVTTSL